VASRRRWPVLAMVAAVAATTCAGLLPAGSASATTRTTPAAATVTVRTVAEKTVTAHRQAGTGATPDATVSCTLYVSFIQVVSPGQAFGPFSPPIVTSLGGVAEVMCTIPVTSLTLDPALALDGDEVTTGIPVFSSGSNVTPLAYAIDICEPGDWQVGGTMGIVWPAGFTPPEATATGFGPFLNIDPSICV
jgi:hypothetical protein